MPQPFACLDGLVRLSHHQGVDIRGPLLRVLTDLYVQEPSHSREEEQQFVELALRLMPDVTPEVRSAIARKLAAYASTPAPVVEALIAAEPDLATLWPPRARPAAAPALTAGSAPEEPVQRRAGNRHLGEIFLMSEPHDRAALLAALAGNDTAAPAVDLPERPGAAARLEQAALRRDRDGFAREMQFALGISRRAAWRIAEDASGELIVAAANALDIGEASLVRMLLFINPAIGESVEQVFSLMRLYGNLPPGATLSIIAGWRDEAVMRTAVRLQPVLAPDSEAAAAARDHARGLMREDAERGPRQASAPDGRQATS